MDSASASDGHASQVGVASLQQSSAPRGMAYRIGANTYLTYLGNYTAKGRPL